MQLLTTLPSTTTTNMFSRDAVEALAEGVDEESLLLARLLFPNMDVELAVDLVQDDPLPFSTELCCNDVEVEQDNSKKQKKYKYKPREYVERVPKNEES